MAPLLLTAFVLLAVASIFALIHAFARAEEGYEDATGYHQVNPGTQVASAHAAINRIEQPRATTVDTGNPWDQINGSSCPWSFNPLGAGGRDNFPTPQT